MLRNRINSLVALFITIALLVPIFGTQNVKADEPARRAITLADVQRMCPTCIPEQIRVMTFSNGVTIAQYVRREVYVADDITLDEGVTFRQFVQGDFRVNLSTSSQSIGETLLFKNKFGFVYGAVPTSVRYGFSPFMTVLSYDSPEKVRSTLVDADQPSSWPKGQKLWAGFVLYDNGNWEMNISSKYPLLADGLVWDMLLGQ